MGPTILLLLAPKAWAIAVTAAGRSPPATLCARLTSLQLSGSSMARSLAMNTVSLAAPMSGKGGRVALAGEAEREGKRVQDEIGEKWQAPGAAKRRQRASGLQQQAVASEDPAKVLQTVRLARIPGTVKNAAAARTARLPAGLRLGRVNLRQE